MTTNRSRVLGDTAHDPAASPLTYDMTVVVGVDDVEGLTLDLGPRQFFVVTRVYTSLL